MGFLNWLTGSDEAPAAVLVTQDEAPAPVPSVDLTFPEFTRVSVPQLQAELEDVLEGYTDDTDRSYGALVVRALVGDDIEPPAMPEDVLRIQRLLASPDCDVPDLAHAITRDPSIAGRFVAVANCSLYARADRARTVTDAVIRIGLKQTSMIVMAIVSKTKLFRVPGFEEQARNLHRHCLGAAVASQLIARRAKVAEGHAFMGGLLHDIGRIWLMSLCGDINRDTQGEHSVDPDTLEAISKRFHEGLGALIVESWGFDDDVVTAILRHHAPGPEEPEAMRSGDPKLRRLCYAIAAGQLTSHAMLNPDRAPPEALPVIAQVLDIDLSPRVQAECFEAFIQFEQLIA